MTDRTDGEARQAAVTATLGLAAGAWIVTVRQMQGMNMGVATKLGSFAFFLALWVWMMAAMMLPGAAPAVARAQATVPRAPCRSSSPRISPSGRSSGSPCLRCTAHTGRSRPGRL